MELDHDTLQMAHDIEAAGLGRKPAEAVARAIHEHSRQLATKTDVERLGKATKADIERLGKATKTDVEQLRQETRADIARLETSVERLRQETKADIARLEESTNDRFNRLEYRLDQLNINIIRFGSGLIIALIAAMVTLALKM